MPDYLQTILCASLGLMSGSAVSVVIVLGLELRSIRKVLEAIERNMRQ